MPRLLNTKGRNLTPTTRAESVLKLGSLCWCEKKSRRRRKTSLCFVVASREQGAFLHKYTAIRRLLSLGSLFNALDLQAHLDKQLGTAAFCFCWDDPFFSIGALKSGEKASKNRFNKRGCRSAAPRGLGFDSSPLPSTNCA